MANAILSSIADLARLRRIDLRPEWADAASKLTGEDEPALETCCEMIGWAPPTRYSDAPRTHEFPLLVFHPDRGWAVVERVEADNRLQVVHNGVATTWPDADRARIYDLVIPLPASRQRFERAIDVFKASVLRRKQVILLAILATVVVNFIALITSLYTMQVYDRVVPRGAFSTLWVLSVGALTALAFDFTLRVVRANLLEREAAHIDTEVSEFFFARAIDARLDTRPPSVGTMAGQLRGMEQVRSMISSGIIFAFADLPFALLFIFVVAQIGGVISIVLLVGFPVALGVALTFAKLIRKDTERTQVSNNRKNGLLVEAMDSAETVKANRGQWYMMSRWGTLLDELHASEVPTKKLQAKAGAIFGTMQQAMYILLIAWGSVEVFENRLSLGGLVACSILAGRVNGPLIAQLPNLLVQWSYSRSALGMLDGILKFPTERAANVDLLRPTRLAPQLTFRDVEFVYPGGRAGVNIPKLTIEAGERIAIVGGVGSGKSTLLKLMSGLYPPQSGQILIDRLDMTQVAEDTLRTHVGYLPQDYRLVNGSLRDNLLLGLPDPGDDRIMEVAQETGLANLITQHPRGLDLPIAEGGRGLSGGQRTLTGLTRLLLAQPKLLLLDEPTSNLDVDTESLVLRTLTKRLSPETTLIIVTHKLQLVGLVNRLMIFANGQVAIDGPAAEVLKRMQRPKTVQEPAGTGPKPAEMGAN
ncbi:ATP-binding cassette domain-containing protein [Novosphingobium album (ex Liu et al. 2023)]|uniref:ATP-binding cassette domain-containing protein n=1 Tax=Novosphingobium album (ex Liu et al. 2023) TaxID=3031130 RepID=A0ABT5WPM1_9SPHN|nr:ATP-binding cassette domain-containing protein [Novosphingobium album (ex Liu et al. 2023)]MDE8651824.1 ATP-binding cassette domain-containing protein [Novosphingobium album (ex Liu et al. 2023)]